MQMWMPWEMLRADVPAWPQPVPVPREGPNTLAWGCPQPALLPTWGRWDWPGMLTTLVLV